MGGTGLRSRLVLACLVAMPAISTEPAGTARPPERASAPQAPIRFVVFANITHGTGVSDILWTGTTFLYTKETKPDILVGDSAGLTVKPFATVTANSGEMRCAQSPGAHGFPKGYIYCHAASDAVYSVSPDGKAVQLFACLPTTQASAFTDGALTFDTVGTFGYTLLVASGGSKSVGGGVYRIKAPGGSPSAANSRATPSAALESRSSGSLTPLLPTEPVSPQNSEPCPSNNVAQASLVADYTQYADGGGADHMFVAPRGFGPQAGQVFITIDHEAPPGMPDDQSRGRLLTMDRAGHFTVIGSALRIMNDPTPSGLNPIAMITGGKAGGAPSPMAGLYLTDYNSGKVFFANAAQFRNYIGDIIVGTENSGKLAIIKARSTDYQVVLRSPVAANPPVPAFNLEGAVYIGG